MEQFDEAAGARDRRGEENGGFDPELFRLVGPARGGRALAVEEGVEALDESDGLAGAGDETHKFADQPQRVAAGLPEILVNAPPGPDHERDSLVLGLRAFALLQGLDDAGERPPARRHAQPVVRLRLHEGADPLQIGIAFEKRPAVLRAVRGVAVAGQAAPLGPFDVLTEFVEPAG